MKIIIAKQKGLNNSYVNWVKDTIEEYLDKFVGLHIDKKIDVSFTDKTIDMDVNYVHQGKQSEGRNYYATDTYYRVQTDIDFLKNDFVIFIYKNTLKLEGTDYVAPVTWTKPISDITGTVFIEIPHDFREKAPTTPIHELVHAMVDKLVWKGYVTKSADQMDVTNVNGINIPYYKNSTPLALGGNFSATLNNIEEYIDFIPGVKKAPIVTQMLAKVYSIPNVIINSTQIKKEPYKYFKLNEKTGSYGTVASLDEQLMHKLDIAREKAGIPFILTSGYRTPEHNKKVGGVADSAHLKRLAVDIQAITGMDKLLIVVGLYKAGFRRIGVSWKGNFVHADIDHTKPDAFYTY